MTSVQTLGLAAVLGLVTLSACGPGLISDDAGNPSNLVPVEDIEQPWLLAIDEDEGTIDALIQVSVEPGAEGEVTVLCPDLELPAGFPDDTNFSSLAYAGGVLYASAMHETWGDTLMRIDPCECTATEVGVYGFDLVSGLASGGGGVMLGIAADDDALIEIDPATANAEQRSVLSEDWVSNGLSAAPSSGQLYGINAQTDRLHLLRSVDALALESVELSKDFLAVGLEYHPGRGVLYACGVHDDGTSLFAVEPLTGEVSLVAVSVFMTTCDNLAGPDELTGPIDCTQ